MSTFAATTAATSRTINVIVSLNDENEPIEFKFLFEKFNWDTLVSLIHSCSTFEPPVVLYYKLTFDGAVKALESQEHLAQLLTVLQSPTTLYFYGNQDRLTFPVVMSSAAAFARLGFLVEQNKQVVRSSRRIARWIGILASMMSTLDKSFEHEFQVLERMIQRKSVKLQTRKNPGNKLVETDDVISAGEDEDFAEAPEVIDLDARLEDLDIGDHANGQRKRGGCGHNFGGRCAFGGCGTFNRRPYPYEFFEGFLGGLNGSDEEARRKFAWAAGGRYHHGKPHPHSAPINSDEESFGGRGGRGFGKFGGRQHRHHGRSHPFAGLGPRPFGVPSDSEEEFFGHHHGKHFGGRGGRGGRGFGPNRPPPAFGGDEELFGGRGFGKHGRHGRFHWE